MTPYIVTFDPDTPNEASIEVTGFRALEGVLEEWHNRQGTTPGAAIQVRNASYLTRKRETAIVGGMPVRLYGHLAVIDGGRA